MTALALPANASIAAASVPLEYHDVPPEKVISGLPRIGLAELPDVGGCAIGIWEIFPSVTTDVEVDETFVVLCGEATVKFANGDPDLELRPGSIARLKQGAKTTWQVTKTLRKIYIIPKP